MQIPKRRFSIVLVAMLLSIPAAGFSDSWEKARQHVRQYVDQAQKDAEQTRAMIDQERQKLVAEVSTLEEAVKQEEARLHEIRSGFDGLQQQEQDSQARFEQEQQDVHRFMEVYLAARKDAETLLSSSLIRAASPSRPEQNDEPAGPEQAPSPADVQQLVEALFAEMEASGKIERQEGAFIGPQGTEVRGEILRIGGFNAFYRTPDEAGFLKLDKAAGHLAAIPASSSWFDPNQEMISDYFDGTADVLPLDLSRGEVFNQIQNSQSLLEYLQSGGPLVWPILMVGLAAFILVVERLLFLARTKANSQKLIAQIQQLASGGRWQECREYCSVHPGSSVCRVLRAGLSNFGGNREALENSLQEAIMKELPRLERFLSTISVLAAVAPLLGLLGTVSGMINTFHAITIYGSGDPRMLSAGISEALITTELGLMIAVPVILLHHFLERRVDAIIGDMEEKSTALTVIMLKNRGIHAGMVSQAA